MKKKKKIEQLNDHCFDILNLFTVFLGNNILKRCFTHTTQMACPRVSFRRRVHYATRSNGVKMVRTPGNRLIAQRRAKRSQGIHTPWVLGHKRIGGTKALRHIQARNAPKHSKTVSRAYGGVLSHDQVRDRIVRAFLMEEQRIVKKVLTAEAKFQKEKKRRDAKKKRQADKKKAIAKKVTGRLAPAKKGAKKVAPVAKKVAKK